MPKAVDYYLLNQGATLARVEDRVHCVASVFLNGGWHRADHVAADVTGIGGDADYDEVSEVEAKRRVPRGMGGRTLRRNRRALR